MLNLESNATLVAHIAVFNSKNMDSFSQAEDPPGRSRQIWTDVLGGTIAFLTLFVPLYVAVAFSSSTQLPASQIVPQTAQRN